MPRFEVRMDTPGETVYVTPLVADGAQQAKERAVAMVGAKPFWEGRKVETVHVVPIHESLEGANEF